MMALPEPVEGIARPFDRLRERPYVSGNVQDSQDQATGFQPGMKTAIGWGRLGCDWLQGDGVAQGLQTVHQASLDMLAVSLIEVMGAQVLIEALLVGY